MADKIQLLWIDLYQKLPNISEVMTIAMHVDILLDMFGKYRIDQVKLFRYAKRRHKKEEIFYFLKDEAHIKIYVEE